MVEGINPALLLFIIQCFNKKINAKVCANQMKQLEVYYTNVLKYYHMRVRKKKHVIKRK